MVDSINSSSVTANRARNTGATGSRDAGAPTGSTPANAEPAASVEVKLSNEIRSSESATFDEVKVKQMRQAIEDGSFPLDARRIAENFAELERLI
jgi:negative regulator of flagellin synthesis FlgM